MRRSQLIVRGTPTESLYILLRYQVLDLSVGRDLGFLAEPVDHTLSLYLDEHDEGGSRKGAACEDFALTTGARGVGRTHPHPWGRCLSLMPIPLTFRGCIGRLWGRMGLPGARLPGPWASKSMPLGRTR